MFFFRALPPNRNSIEYHGHPRVLPEKHHKNIIEIPEGCHSNPIKLPKPEKRRRKPGMSLNGDRSVEGMGHGRECGGGVGMARLCGVWCVEGVERGKECGGRGRGRWKVGKGREKRREIYCLHSKQTTSHCLACGNHSNHLPPLTPPLKQQHLSATLTLRHFTHYMLRSTLYTLYFTL